MVKVEKVSDVGLEYKAEIEVSEVEVNRVYQKRLAEVAKNVQLKGFRPGKVPLSVVESKFGKGICQEVANEIIQHSFQDAVAENNLSVAGLPKIDAKPLTKHQAYQYSATFEVYPEIHLNTLDGVEIEKNSVTVTDEDIADMVANIQKQQAVFEKVEQKAEEGFRVNMDFKGLKGGVPFEGGTSEGFDLVLGSGQFIEGFEDQLIGVQAGDKKELNLTFPEKYPVQDLAGQAVVFHVSVHYVEKPVLPDLDDEFAKKVGFDGGMSDFRLDIKSNMEREVEGRIEQRFKSNVLDALLAKNAIAVPNALVDTEIEHMQKMSLQQMAQQHGVKELPKVTLPRDPFLEEATKRVKLGLLLAEVIKSNDLKVDGDLVRERIEKMAASYKDKEQVVSWYYSNEKMLAEIEAVVLEDQAIQHLVSSTPIKEVALSYADLMKENK